MQGSKFTVANVQFATGSRTFAPNKNNLGANLLLQHLAHFHNKYIFCSLLEYVHPSEILANSWPTVGRQVTNSWPTESVEGSCSSQLS